MPLFKTLPEALENINDKQIGIYFINDEKNHEFISYKDLINYAKNLLTFLNSKGIQKENELVITFHSLKNFVISYWACLMGGIIPVPLTIPKSYDEIAKLINVWSVLKAPWMIFDDMELKEKFEKYATNQEVSNIVEDIFNHNIFCPDCHKDFGVKPLTLPEIKEDDIAFIQFSSGSTGNPKGVVLTHKNLLCNVYDIMEASQISERDSLLSWKPITHDFGMIAFHILPIVAGCMQYRMPTKLFIWNPTYWFSVVNQYRITVLGSPNFGIQHFTNRFDVRKAKEELWDLSCVRIIFNAAEMIYPSLCRDFISIMKPFGLKENVFKPGYGLAENTLVVSVCQAYEDMKTIYINRNYTSIGQKIVLSEEKEKDATEYVQCGKVCSHSMIRIMDEHRQPLDENQVGLIYVKGSCVTQGYYRNEEATSNIITEDYWLNTQDVGFIHDGQVVIIGREKEIIIIGGINYYPADIENAILQEVGSNKLNQYIACGISNKDLGTEKLAIFVYHKGKYEDFLPIIKQVKHIVMEKLGLTVDKVIPIRQIPKTTSGKVQRYKIICDYLQGYYEDFEEYPEKFNDTHKEFNSRIIAILDECIQLKKEDYDRSFFDLGCSSIQLINVQNHIEKRLGMKLESTLILDYPIVKDFIKKITELKSDTDIQKNVEWVHHNDHEDIAIVGMSLRFPGNIHNAEILWDMLSAGNDVVKEIEEERWAHSTLDLKNITTTYGGYLDTVEDFDPYFFNITPKEAVMLDPQQRILLELTWEAFENAGINPAIIRNTNFGVFIGISSNDYIQVGKNLGHEPETYTYTGGMFNSAAGRIAYEFGLQGPCLAIDTACSSSLYAIHQCVQELQNGNCYGGVVGAVNLILSPEGHISFSKLKALSPTGRCKSFDNSADGYIRSEGGAVLILKRLSDAKKDKDNILAVIKGTAVNHNGHSGGLTVPSGLAQKEVILRAMKLAGKTIEDISYIEAHGSGTPLGDPQEVNALADIFNSKKDTLHIGSIKSNIGHLEAAAGLAGVCKVILSLMHKQLPGNLHFKKGNSLIDWEHIPIAVVSDLLEWKGNNHLLTAGISSFGISGSNAHIIIEEYKKDITETSISEKELPPYLLTVSAKSRKALKEYISNLSRWLKQREVNLYDFCHTLNTKRANLRYRANFLLDNLDDLQYKFHMTQEKELGTDSIEYNSSLVFVFTGQGSQYPKMAYDLYCYSKHFKSKLDELDSAFRKLGGFSLIEFMFRSTGEDFNRPIHAQPMIFAVEVALAYYWEKLGIVPDVVLGHSIGEYAAAHIAGVLSLEDAVKIVLIRAKVMEETPENGYMVTLLADLNTVMNLTKDYEDVSIAAINATENITISGSAISLELIKKAARKQRIFVEKLEVSHPFHSVLMVDRAKLFLEEIKQITFKEPNIKFISTQTGEFVAKEVICNGLYWSNNLVNTVLFQKSIAFAMKEGHQVFVEVGAMATLSGIIAQDQDTAVVIPSLRKGFPALKQIRESVGNLWIHGFNIQWNNYYESEGNFVENIPNTSYDKQKIWYEDKLGDMKRLKGDVVDSSNKNQKEQVPVKVHLNKNNIKEFIKQKLKQITGIPVEKITDTLGLFSLGLDSLMLMQLGKSIQEKFQVDIPLKVFFTKLHTLDLLSDYIELHQPVIIAAEIEQKPYEMVNELNLKNDNTYEAAGLQSIIHHQLKVMEEQLHIFRNDFSVGEEKKFSINGKNEKVKKPGSYTNNIELEEDELTDRQREFIDEFVKNFIKKTGKSREYTEKNRTHLADWLAAVNFNPCIKDIVYPIVSASSEGSKFTDIDGNQYIDTAIGYGVSFFGHKPEFITKALQEQLEKGFELGPQCKSAGEAAFLFHDIVGVDRVAFCNTGTEAVMVALRLARAVTGRDKIVKFITSFHGSFDGVLAEADGEESKPMTIGIPQSMVDETLTLVYGSQESLDIIKKQGESLAAIIVEPVQTRNPSLQPREFLHQLRNICNELDIALIFDEMVTGFRIALGGAQEYFGVQADMVLYGKLVGGGMPIGIVAGKDKYLNAVDGGTWSLEDDSKPLTPTTFFAGTFCKHPLTMAVCKSVLEYMKEHGREKIEELNKLTIDFEREANAFFECNQVPLKVVHFGSMYRYEQLVSTDMTKLSLELNLFFKLMLDAGIYIWERRTCFFSIAHTVLDKDKILEALRKSVERLREGGFTFRTANNPEDPTPLDNIKETFIKKEQSNSNISIEEKRIYILSNLKGGNETYQILGSLHFQDKPDLDKLKEAFYQLSQKHEKLRCSYQMRNYEVHSTIEEEISPEYHLFEDDKDWSQEDILRVMNKPFDLSKAPLWRYGIYSDKEGTYHLVVSFHHIIADGNSIEIILSELASNLKENKLIMMTSCSYQDYVNWESNIINSDTLNTQRQWWLNQYETIPMPMNLPTDSPRKEIYDFMGKHYFFEMDSSLYEKAKKIMNEYRITPFIFYLSAWAVLLKMISHNNDFCIGIPLDQRIKGSYETTIGMFAQTLPLRMKINKSNRFSEVMENVRDLIFNAMDNSLYTYEMLIEELDIPRDYSRNALFDIMFTYTNAKNRVYEFGDVTGITEDFPSDHSPFEISFELTERNGGLYGDLNYASPLFSDSRMETLIKQYSTLIDHILHDPNELVGNLTFLDNETSQKILKQGIGENIDIHSTIHEVFKKVFDTYKNEPALRFRDQSITFHELDSKVQKFAGFLQHKGFVKGDLVGILLPSSPEYIVCMLAILRIGCGWLPMDIEYPVKRLKYMLEDSKATAVICEKEIYTQLGTNITAYCLEEIEKEGEYDFYIPPVDYYDLCYVIYTSGSTGNPKGVMLGHGALLNFLIGMPIALNWKIRMRTACMTTPSFDIFLLESLLTLSQGGCVVIADKNDNRDPLSIASYIIRNNIDYLQMTPTKLQMLFSNEEAVYQVLSNIKMLLIGGEPFPKNLLLKLQEHKNLRIWNVYGPTETCIWSTVKELTTEEEVSIGKPIANTNIYILDEDMQLLNEDCIGNLWIGGMGLANGYLGNPELTMERFVKNPFGEGKIYITGDQAMWKNGELYCLGRIDNQVKIRGYRIELEEIEQVLQNHEGIESAAATIQDLGNHNRTIIGFYVLKQGYFIDKDELKKWMIDKLPDYMVPGSLVQIDTIPQTQNGKKDRSSLIHQILIKQEEVLQENTESGTLQEELAAIWRTILGPVEIGYHHSFFDLGGNSFSIILLHTELNKAYPNMLEVTDLFANPTIYKLKNLIENKMKEDKRKNFGNKMDDNWICNTKGEKGYLEITLEDNTRSALSHIAGETKMNVIDLSYAIFALYLNKCLGSKEITLCLHKDNNKITPIKFNFSQHDFSVILKDFQSQLQESSLEIELRDLKNSSKGSGIIHIGCCNQKNSDWKVLLEYFELILLVSVNEDKINIRIEYSNSMNGMKLKQHLKKYVKLIELLGADNT